MRRTALLLLILFMSGCSASTGTPVAPPSGQEIQAEEIRVYSALLSALYPDMHVVLMDETVGDGNLDAFLETFKDLEPETAASYQVRNGSAHPLDPQMDLEMEFSLLSQADMRLLFDVNQNGWDMFYNRYPQAPGITTLSRVGFNATLDQALLAYGTQSHWLAGAGYYVLLEKIDGIWTILQQEMIWIS